VAAAVVAVALAVVVVAVVLVLGGKHDLTILAAPRRLHKGQVL
jgi:hypothetical protein